MVERSAEVLDYSTGSVNRRPFWLRLTRGCFAVFGVLALFLGVGTFGLFLILRPRTLPPWGCLVYFLISALCFHAVVRLRPSADVAKL